MVQFVVIYLSICFGNKTCLLNIFHVIKQFTFYIQGAALKLSNFIGLSKKSSDWLNSAVVSYVAKSLSASHFFIFGNLSKSTANRYELFIVPDMLANAFS